MNNRRKRPCVGLCHLNRVAKAKVPVKSFFLSYPLREDDGETRKCTCGHFTTKKVFEKYGLFLLPFCSQNKLNNLKVKVLLDT